MSVFPALVSVSEGSDSSEGEREEERREGDCAAAANPQNTEKQGKQIGGKHAQSPGIFNSKNAKKHFEKSRTGALYCKVEKNKCWPKGLYYFVCKSNVFSKFEKIRSLWQLCPDFSWLSTDLAGRGFSNLWNRGPQHLGATSGTRRRPPR